MHHVTQSYGAGMIAAFAGITLSLGIVYWLLSKKSAIDGQL